MSKQAAALTLKELYKNAVKESSAVIGEIDGVEIEMIIKKTLSVKDFGQFVADMSDAEFTGGDYFPQSAKILFAVNLVKYYTNLNLPADIISAYEIVSGLGLDGKVIEAADKEQYTNLCQAVKAAQEYAKSQKTGLSGLIAVIRRKIEQFDSNEIMRTLQDFTPEQLENLTELKNMADIFTAKQAMPQSAKILEFPAETGSNGE